MYFNSELLVCSSAATELVLTIGVPGGRSGDESRFRTHVITVWTHARRLSIMASSTLGRGRSVTAPSIIIARANNAEVFGGLLGELDPYELIWAGEWPECT